MYNTKHLGKKIRLYRLKKGLTLEKMAEICNLSTKGLEKIEFGDSDPKWSNLAKIAVALGMDLGDLSSCAIAIVESQSISLR